MFDNLAYFYDTGPFGLATLCALGATTFAGHLDTKWQLVQACADAGISEAQIDTAVALLTTKRQRFWKYTNVIDRDNPFSSGLRTNLVPVPTPNQWNAIFLAAAALDQTIV